MMSKRPEERPTSANELLSWVKRLGVGETQRLSHVAPISDTAVNEVAYQATVSDSSFSGDIDSGDIEVVTEAVEFGFDDLPACQARELAVE